MKTTTETHLELVTIPRAEHAALLAVAEAAIEQHKHEVLTLGRCTSGIFGQMQQRMEQALAALAAIRKS